MDNPIRKVSSIHLFSAKRGLKYRLKLFWIAIASLWGGVAIFAALEYQNVKRYRIEALSNSVELAVGNILTGYSQQRDITPFLNFWDSYLKESSLKGISMSVYDTTTGEKLYSIGQEQSPNAAQTATLTTLPPADNSRQIKLINVIDGDVEQQFIYHEGLSADGKIVVKTYMPLSEEIDNIRNLGSTFWIILLTILVGGSVLAWVVTAHQAKNITLLHEFASRAATDPQFIPMADFPKDEIGDISRQIVAIYNARSQAIARRDHEHVIALKAMAEKNNLKRVMTNNISHELKTPVGIVRSYIEMILSNPDMSEEDRTRFLTKAQENIERLVTMMNNLSTMTRLEDSGGKIPISDINFHDLVFSLVEDFSQSGLLNSIEFSYDVPIDCHIYGNGELLIAIFTNLAKNAVAYSQGTEIGIVLVGENEKFYTFSFYDNGVGVSEEHLPHLFDRFYRIDAGRSRKVGGTGLGLSIVKSSINTMGGSVIVRNRQEGGLEYLISLRRVCEEKQVVESENESLNE